MPQQNEHFEDTRHGNSANINIVFLRLLSFFFFGKCYQLKFNFSKVSVTNLNKIVHQSIGIIDGSPNSSIYKLSQLVGTSTGNLRFVTCKFGENYEEFFFMICRPNVIEGKVFFTRSD